MIVELPAGNPSVGCKPQPASRSGSPDRCPERFPRRSSARTPSGPAIASAPHFATSGPVLGAGGWNGEITSRIATARSSRRPNLPVGGRTCRIRIVEDVRPTVRERDEAAAPTRSGPLVPGLRDQLDDIGEGVASGPGQTAARCGARPVRCRDRPERKRRLRPPPHRGWCAPGYPLRSSPAAASGSTEVSWPNCTCAVDGTTSPTQAVAGSDRSPSSRADPPPLESARRGQRPAGQRPGQGVDRVIGSGGDTVAHPPSRNGAPREGSACGESRSRDRLRAISLRASGTPWSLPAPSGSPRSIAAQGDRDLVVGGVQVAGRERSSAGSTSVSRIGVTPGIEISGIPPAPSSS